VSAPCQRPPPGAAAPAGGCSRPAYRPQQRPLQSSAADQPSCHPHPHPLPRSYQDFTTTASGLQFKDLRDGEGELPAEGDTAVVDWSGYTIGYYGRPFEARNKVRAVATLGWLGRVGELESCGGATCSGRRVGSSAHARTP
jgi:hypothetical protein